MPRFDLLGIADNHGVLHGIDQLADIAGPVVLHQCGHRVFRNSQAGLVHLLGKLGGIVLDEQRDIVATFTQCRQSDLHPANAIEQVTAELAFLDQVFEVVVGGADEADIDMLGLVGTHTDHFSRLKDTQ